MKIIPLNDAQIQKILVLKRDKDKTEDASKIAKCEMDDFLSELTGCTINLGVGLNWAVLDDEEKNLVFSNYKWPKIDLTMGEDGRKEKCVKA